MSACTELKTVGTCQDLCCGAWDCLELTCAPLPGVSVCLSTDPLGFDHTECVSLIKISLKTEAVEKMRKMLGTQLANAEPQVRLNLKK